MWKFNDFNYILEHKDEIIADYNTIIDGKFIHNHETIRSKYNIRYGDYIRFKRMFKNQLISHKSNHFNIYRYINDLTENDIDNIAKLYNKPPKEKLKNKEICAIFNINEQTFYTILKKYSNKFNRIRNFRDINEENKIKCYSCNNYYDVDEMVKDPKCKYGCRSLCKNCYNKHYRELYRNEHI